MVVDEEDSLSYEYAKLELGDSQKGVVLRREEIVALLTRHLHTNP
jgi:hypothetical protein